MHVPDAAQQRRYIGVRIRVCEYTCTQGLILAASIRKIIVRVWLSRHGCTPDSRCTRVSPDQPASTLDAPTKLAKWISCQTAIRLHGRLTSSRVWQIAPVFRSLWSPTRSTGTRTDITRSNFRCMSVVSVDFNGRLLKSFVWNIFVEEAVVRCPLDTIFLKYWYLKCKI